MLKLFSCKRRLRALGQELPPVRPELRDLASTTRTHVSAPSQRGAMPPMPRFRAASRLAST
jgi:hypothetical protein